MSEKVTKYHASIAYAVSWSLLKKCENLIDFRPSILLSVVDPVYASLRPVALPSHAPRYRFRGYQSSDEEELVYSVEDVVIIYIIIKKKRRNKNNKDKKEGRRRRRREKKSSIFL